MLAVGPLELFLDLVHDSGCHLAQTTFLSLWSLTVPLAGSLVGGKGTLSVEPKAKLGRYRVLGSPSWARLWTTTKKVAQEARKSPMSSDGDGGRWVCRGLCGPGVVVVMVRWKDGMRVLDMDRLRRPHQWVGGWRTESKEHKAGSQRRSAGVISGLRA